ncbi:MAG: methylated-DNA--[protein]-cysteine S-methyltransferase [Phycisphaerales bacterium]|nr:methylated-DNA--[protein]-cysteine S-methyltransferase [Phycisphaerales bacterium]
MSTDYERVRLAIAYVQANVHQQPTLRDISRHVGLSAPYLQRVFRRWAGVSPKRFLQFLSSDRAKQLLRGSASVLDTAFAVGLSGPGRLHDLVVAAEAVTPGEYSRAGRGLAIGYGLHDSPFGRCLIAATPRGICALRFTAHPRGADEIDELRAEWPMASIRADQTGTAALARAVFAGRPAGRILLHLRGTNFQLKVWEGLLRIPDGCALSYQDLARRLGVPDAARAVAGAVGANPVGYLIPCHRVLRSTGALGGYRWGEDRKAMMLAREMARPGPRREHPETAPGAHRD